MRCSPQAEPQPRAACPVCKSLLPPSHATAETEELWLTLSLNTPAFLGDATQQAQWRAPPLKALLRRWWRVAHASKAGYDHAVLLCRERHVFGTAGQEESDDLDGQPKAERDRAKANRSHVQLRLSSWQAGSGPAAGSRAGQAGEGRLASRGSATGNSQEQGYEDARKYLGFGPVTDDRSSLEAGPPGTHPITLRIRVASVYRDDIVCALQLAAWFGSVGARSRNGWGSLCIEGEDIEGYSALTRKNLEERRVLRRLGLAIGHEQDAPDGQGTQSQSAGRQWPHAIGLREEGQSTDSVGQPAIWVVSARAAGGQPQAWRSPAPSDTLLGGQGFASWKDVMVRLKEFRRGLNACLINEAQQICGAELPAGGIEPRHMLSYPAGEHHELAGAKAARLANQVCFKVARHADRYFGLIYHLPWAVPDAFLDSLQERTGPSDRPEQPSIGCQMRVWRRVHQFLQAESNGPGTPRSRGSRA